MQACTLKCVGTPKEPKI